MLKKKLVIFIPSIEGGGVEKNFFIVANYFAKNHYNTSVITANSNMTGELTKKIELITPKYKLWKNRNRRIKYLICLFLLLKEILKNKNLTVFAFQANLYCVILCKVLGIKVLTRSNSAPFGWSSNIFKKFFYKILLKCADDVMVNSKKFKLQMKKYFNVNTKCIYNPLDKKKILEKSKIKSRKIFFKKNTIKIINIGRFVEQKDHITLLKALNLLKNKVKFEAVIMGKGHLKNYYQNFINKNNLNANIKIINFKKNPYPYLKQADVFILTSIYEGLPNVLLEAITLKKCVISSDCPTGPNEILLDGKGGMLFKMKDYKSLSKKILIYNKNKKLFNKLLNTSLRNLERFDFYTNLKKYEKFVNPYL